MSLPVALQLYTLREETEKDFVGTLEKVAALGYKGVEFAGYGNLSSSELKEHLGRLGLKAVGSHVGLELLKNDLDEVIRYNKEIGNPHIVCPWANPDTKEGYLELAAFLNEAGKKIKEAGLQLCYHNHAHEFMKFDGEYGLDLIYANTDPEVLKVELDTYWVVRADVKPTEYLKQYAGRTPLVHLKDMEAGEDKHFAEIGNGVIDIKAIADTAEEIGAQWVIVEQDRCKRPALESVTISMENLKKMGIA